MWGFVLHALGAWGIGPGASPSNALASQIMAHVLRFLGLATLCISSLAQGSTLRYLNLQQLVDASELVVRGRAVHQESFWQDRRIVTRVRVAVDEVWVGRVPASREVDVLTLGGVVDGIGQRVDGAAVLPAGEDLVVQLSSGADHALWPVALSQGVWVLAQEPSQKTLSASASIPIAVSRPSTDRLVASRHNPVVPMPTTVQALKAAILEAAHGR